MDNKKRKFKVLKRICTCAGEMHPSNCLVVFEVGEIITEEIIKTHKIFESWMPEMIIDYFEEVKNNEGGE